MSFGRFERNVGKITLPEYGEVEYVWQNKDVLTIDFTEMYSAKVEMSYKFLRAMVEYFGTEEVETDDVNQDGCETCDWGSRYGFVLVVHKPTKNVPEKLEKSNRNRQ